MARSFKVLAIKKQGYPATFSFGDEANGTSGTDIGLIDSIIANDSVYSGVIIASEDGHKKVFEVNASGDNGKNTQYYHNFSATQTSATIEYWIKFIDNGTGQYYFVIEDASNNLVQILYDVSNNKLTVFHAAIFTQVDVSADAWTHIRVKFDTGTDRQWVWVNGISLISDVAFLASAVSDGLTKCRWQTFGAAANDDLQYYLDAYGESWDANYKIGDNCFWRHYKENIDDPFESEDVGTKSLSIAWVDAIAIGDNCQIIAEFNEHKKILRQWADSAVVEYAEHHYPTDSTTGWASVWLKTDDVTLNAGFYVEDSPDQCVQFRIFNSLFQVKTGGAWRTVTNSPPVPVNDTYYFIYVQWYADDTFDLWIDNVQYEDGTAMFVVMTDGIDRFGLNNAGTALLTNNAYFDAPTCSLDATSPERGDNRLFDYNATYTSEDVTDKIINVITTNQLGKWLKGVLLTKETYENSEIFVQIYDVNGKLGMEAELSDRIQALLIKGKYVPGETYTYPLRDKNEDDLKNESTNTFSASKIHDPTDSTSMLKVILPNVSEADGDLILVEGDVKNDTYSPTTHNYPDFLMLTDIGDLGDSVVIIRPDGKCYLDDDKASGTSLDLDIEADKDKMTDSPLISDILEEVNYVVIKGAINTATGERFVKVVDTVGDDKKKTVRITNNNFKTQTDVDNYAAKIAARAVTVKKIKFTAQSLGAHNMGETLDYKFVDALYNVPQKDYYVVFEELNYDLNENTIILSEGMLEVSKYAAEYEKPEEYNNSYAGIIYDTDIITITPRIALLGGAVRVNDLVQLNAVNEGGSVYWLIDDEIDETRNITVTWVWYRSDANNDTLSFKRYISVTATDGSEAEQVVDNNVVETWNACANDRFEKKTWILTPSSYDYQPGDLLGLICYMNEAARALILHACLIKYYIKRSLS